MESEIPGYAAEEFQLRFMRIGMDVNAVTDSHMMKIGAALAGEETLVIAITLSGETAEVLESIRIAKSRGASIICMTAVSGSSVAKESQEVIQVATLKNLEYRNKNFTAIFDFSNYGCFILLLFCK